MNINFHVFKINIIPFEKSNCKNITDALAGVVYRLTRRRENWVKYCVFLVSVSESIKNIIDIAKQ